MNEYEDCLYEYIMENRFNSAVADPEYREAQASRDRAEKVLVRALPPERQEQFYAYVEQENALRALDLRHMLRETLRLLRGALCS